MCKGEGHVSQLRGKEPDIQTVAVYVNTRYITQNRINIQYKYYPIAIQSQKTNFNAWCKGRLLWPRPFCCCH